jgi:hypothetical protein
MPFTTHLYRSTLSSPRAAEARQAALKAVADSMAENVEEIERNFGIEDWVVVL